jgi:hypothetical protein
LAGPKHSTEPTDHVAIGRRAGTAPDTIDKALAIDA